MSQPTDEQIRAAVQELAFSLSDASDHLSDEDVQRFVRGQLSAEERRLADEHVRACDVCGRAVDDLKRWTAPSAAPGFRRLALAAAILLAVAVPAIVYVSYVGPGSSRASSSPAVRASLDGLDALDPADRARVTAALDSGAASAPAVLRDLRESREVTLGPAAPEPPFELTAPVGTVTLSDRPQFSWTPLAGATSYMVTVFDEAAHVIQRGASVQTTAWTPTEALPRETTFVWQVAANRGHDTVVAPLSPAPPAKFRVVGGADAERLAHLEAAHPQAHLVLGILYAEAGVVDAAAAHLEQVPATDPHAAVARETLARLHSPSR